MTSLIVSANRSAAHDLLISGDSDGYLRLFRFASLLKNKRAFWQCSSATA